MSKWPAPPPVLVKDGLVYVTLTQGRVAIVDVIDLAVVENVKWYATQAQNTCYATRSRDGKGLHRIIIDPPHGLEVDHKDRDGLNNRRENLRVATHAQNRANRPGWGFSSYKGVSRGDGTKWVACAGAIHVGVYDTEIDAALAHDRVAYELDPEFAFLNFPEVFR
jgi:hypothetical protein